MNNEEGFNEEDLELLHDRTCAALKGEFPVDRLLDLIKLLAICHTDVLQQEDERWAKQGMRRVIVPSDFEGNWWISKKPTVGISPLT